MGLKKYEIITVGSDKRVRALRSWQVQDRYVNIGDVGGIVYDEKTLSQDGACWLFRGNFGFPGARIGGDSIVDVGEAAPDATGSANLDILGSSVLVGSKLIFGARRTEADAVVLTADDFEQGTIDTPVVGGLINKLSSSSYIRSKNPIFLGGSTLSIGAAVGGYRLRAIAVDRDEVATGSTPFKVSGTGVTLTAPAGQYAYIVLSKDPVAATVPADAADAQITFTGTYETKLSIIDSRVDINPATSTGTLSLRPGGTYTMAPGAKYPDSVIQNSKVSVMTPVTGNRTITLMAEFINTIASIDASVETAPAIIGIYKNVKNLTFTGSATGDASVGSRGVIQAYNCDNMVVSPTIFPGLGAAITANTPFTFQGCNVPNGIFYHHSQIANTYRGINFDLATKDLGKLSVNGYVMVSSEVEGMYRLYSTTGSLFGALAEAHDSVKSLNMTGGAATYGTTIYKDAYLNGLFDFTGTNVFGNKVRSHPLAQVLNVQPRAVRGGFNTATTPPTVVPGQLTNTVMNVPLRINGANGLKVENVPAGVRYMYVMLDANLKFVQNSTWKTGTSTIEAALLGRPYAMIQFNRESGGELTPADLAGVTVTVYNGCKIMNTGATAVNMRGNIRVEDNATLVNASITGSGYFGGNSVVYYNPTVWRALNFNGTVYMKDNAVFAPSVANDGVRISLLEMKDNATFAGGFTMGEHGYDITMTDAARCLGTVNTFRCSFNMHGNSFVAAGSAVVSDCSGLLVMKDDARIENGSLTATGHITLCGKYKQTANRTWTGKRVIFREDAPTYDDNVKTQYDF